MTTHERTILDELTVTDPLDKKLVDQQMGTLGETVNRLLDQQKLIIQMEEQLKEAKALERGINQGEIPALMASLGFDSVTVDGRKINVKDSVQCSIPAAERPNAFSWMDKNGHGSLIKTALSAKFNRGESDASYNAQKTLEAIGIIADLAESVHSGTLKAWAREELALGHSLPSDLFKVHVVKITTVK